MADKKSKQSLPPKRSTLAERAHAKADATFWQPKNPGESVEGLVIRIAHDQGKYGSTHWHVQQDDGTVVIVSASPDSVLDGKLAGEHLELGYRVYVEFLGEKVSKGGSEYKDWATASEPPAGNGKMPVGGEPPADNDIPY